MKDKIIGQFKKYKLEDTVLIAHADHDGLCTSLGLNFLFGDIKPIFYQSFRPHNLPYTPAKFFVICDLLLSEKQIMDLLRFGKEVINFDHHDLRDIQNEKYLCLNPKKIYEKTFMSSSGLIWKLFEPKKIDWILAAGSAGDIAVEDNLELFEAVHKKYPELLAGLDLKTIYNSKIYEIAQILLMSFDNPSKGFEILKESINRGYKVIYESELYSLHLKKQKSMIEFLESNKDKICADKNFVIINCSDKQYSGSYSVKLNLLNSDDRLYIDYDNGRLFFRNFFGGINVQNVAKLFGGGGAHPRVGGAYTRKSFEDVVATLKEFFASKLQSTLFHF